MASSQKKRAMTMESGTDSFSMDEEIQADFEGRNLEEQDFNGIRQLLRQLFLKEHVDVSKISDMLIAQEGIGSVLKQSWNEDEEDDEEDDTLTEALDVFGVTSVLNLSSNRDTGVIQQLFELMQRITKDNVEDTTTNKINDILNNANRLGLLINERFVNLPPKISDPLFTSLLEELSRMAKRDPSYKFDYIILICKIYKSKRSKENIIFSNAEEEIFQNDADVSVEYNVSSQCDTALVGQWDAGDSEMIPFRRILFIHGSKFPSIIEKVKAFVS
ncbi:hypothetical protein FQA39_LY05886 [Lamprigera yunnana]|nr:hypothetical protein FQA39_LY05886 [Lamprigera yunnana]